MLKYLTIALLLSSSAYADVTVTIRPGGKIVIPTDGDGNLIEDTPVFIPSSRDWGAQRRAERRRGLEALAASSGITVEQWCENYRIIHSGRKEC